MNDLVWDKRMLGAFKALACLSEEEEIVLDDWAHERSIVHTSMTYHMSVRKINNIRARLRKKYDGVQPYAELPQRNIRA
jgi:hypothetical protein